MSILERIPENNEIKALKWLKAYGEALLLASEKYKQANENLETKITVSPSHLDTLKDKDMLPIQRQFRDLYKLQELVFEKLKEIDYPILNSACLINVDSAADILNVSKEIKSMYPNDYTLHLKSNSAIVHTSSKMHDFCISILSEKLKRGREQFHPLDEGKIPPMLSGMSTPSETQQTLLSIAERISCIEKSVNNSKDYNFEA